MSLLFPAVRRVLLSAMVVVVVFLCSTGGVTAASANAPTLAPTLTEVDQVTTKASSVPSANAWGANADRLVRTPSGDLYTTYIANGPDHEHFRWVLVERRPGHIGWTKVASGLTAHQPGNPPAVLLGPSGIVYVVTISPWNSAAAGAPVIWNSVSKRITRIPGDWSTGRDLLGATSVYPAAAIDSRGDIFVWENVVCPDFRYPSGRGIRCKNVDVPGTVYWAYRRAGSRTWHSEHWVSPYRYSYDFLLPQGGDALTVVGTRDILEAPFEAPYPCPGDERAHYCLDQTVQARWTNLKRGPSSLIIARAAGTLRGYTGDHRASAEDAYVDSLGRTHILVTVVDPGSDGQFANHELVIDPAGNVSDTLYYAVPYPNLSRIVQDPSGQFWIYSVGPSLTVQNTCDVFIASAGADGTEFGPTTVIPFPSRFNCDSETRNYDTSARSGTTATYYIDGVVATNGGSDWVHYRIALP